MAIKRTTKRKLSTVNYTRRKTGLFGPIYRQFENKPREAMKYLQKVKEGECPKAFYREDIGYVDIVWGECDQKAKNGKGFGLEHILIDHGDEIKQLNINPIDFLILIFNVGKLKMEENGTNRIYLEGETFRMVITTKFSKFNKKLILTAFDLRKIYIKNPKRAKQLQKRASNQ